MKKITIHLAVVTFIILLFFQPIIVKATYLPPSSSMYELSFSDNASVTVDYEKHSFYLKGQIFSGYPITNVMLKMDAPTMIIPDECITYDSNRGPTLYNLDWLSDKVNNTFFEFGDNVAGVYTISITATNSIEETVEKTFEIIYKEWELESQNIEIVNPVYPIDILTGEYFNIHGEIISNDGDLLNVTATVFDENNNIILQETDYPNSSKYELNGYNNSGIINKNLSFNTLKRGTYIYQVSATNKNSTDTLIYRTFDVYGDSVLDNLSNRITCGYGGYDGHYGTDIGESSNFNSNIVYPFEDGVVIKLENNWNEGMGKDPSTLASYGNYVVIQHSDNYWTRYAHLSSVNVEVGQSVTKNTILGIIGKSGNVTGPHLHLELLTNFSNNTRTNIEPYLKSGLPE